MVIGSLSQANTVTGFGGVTSWVSKLVKNAAHNIKKLTRLDVEDFHTVLPIALETEIMDLQRKLMNWLRTNQDKDLNKKITEILRDASLTASLRVIRKQIEALKAAHGGQVPHKLQLLMSISKAPEIKNVGKDIFMEEASLITDHYLEKLVNGSVSLRTLSANL